MGIKDIFSNRREKRLQKLDARIYEAQRGLLREQVRGAIIKFNKELKRLYRISENGMLDNDSLSNISYAVNCLITEFNSLYDTHNEVSSGVIDEVLKRFVEETRDFNQNIIDDPVNTICNMAINDRHSLLKLINLCDEIILELQ